MVATDGGRAAIQAWLSGGGMGGNPIAMGFGTGSGLEVSGNTALEAETGTIGTGREILATVSITTNKQVTFESLIYSTDASGIQISEVGLFNTSGVNTGNMYGRTTIVPSIKNYNEEWNVFYTLTFG